MIKQIAILSLIGLMLVGLSDVTFAVQKVREAASVASRAEQPEAMNVALEKITFARENVVRLGLHSKDFLDSFFDVFTELSIRNNGVINVIELTQVLEDKCGEDEECLSIFTDGFDSGDTSAWK